MTAPIDVLIQSAIWAPSGDNTQAYQFRVQEAAGVLEISVDPSRDTSPMNAGERMSRIAVGAAAENVVVAALQNGWVVEVGAKNGGDSSVVVDCTALRGKSGEVPAVIRQRVTNRRLYDGREITPADIALVEQAARPAESVRAIWVTDRGVLPALATEIGKADAQMFGMQDVRRAFLESVRFDRQPTEEVEEGLSLGCLEANWSERLGLRVLGRIPDSLFRWLGMAGTFRKKAVNLVRSASGVCVLMTTGNDPTTDFDVGRLMERAWLELTARGFAVQPMMSFPVLDSMRTHLPKESLPPSFEQQTNSLAAAFQSILKTEKNERIAAILRFGYAPPPTGRTGRRPLPLR